MKLVLVLICFIYFSNADLEDVNLDMRWEEYKIKFNKSYLDKNEDKEHRKYFLESARMVEQHNMEADEGLHSYRLKINHMSDMSPDELKLCKQCNIMYTPPNESRTFPDLNFTISRRLPKHIDWRKRNIVTRVKDQGGQCGSCWAFAAVGALESHLALKTGELVRLSEQNVVDCAKGANGCNGGTVTAAFDYIVNNNGINTEDYYPYTGQKGRCKFSEEHIGGTCKNYKEGCVSEERVKQIVACKGPVATEVNAGLEDFLSYGCGIYSNDKCDENERNHAVLIVGYGEKNGVEYWIIKNSWGPQWGMNGYMHIKRNAPFMCGIGKYIVYPIV